MRLIIRAIILVVICTITIQRSSAQDFVWGLAGGAFIDNLEGGKGSILPRTLGGAWVAPRIGASVNNGKHNFMAGFDFTQQFGQTPFSGLPMAQIFYNYRGNKGANYMFGLFPRSELQGEYSRSIFSDSLHYFNHTIQGILMQWSGKRVSGEIFFDWFHLNRARKEEAFMVAGAIKWNITREVNISFNGYYAHNKLSSSIFLLDIATYNPMIGLDFSTRTALNRLGLQIGILGSLTRERISVNNAGYWESAFGLNALLTVDYKGFKIENEIYWGNPLRVLWGSKYYTDHLYNRSELSWNYTLMKKGKKSIFLQLAMVLNMTSRGGNFTQKASVTINL